MRKVLALAGLLCLAAVSIAQISPFKITWSTYKSGSYSSVKSFKTFTMRSQSDFAQYWAESTGNPSSTAPKDIDWLKYEVLAIHLGKRTGSGFSVSVDSIEMVTGANYNVQAVETSGHSGSGSKDSTSPYTIILLPRRYATYNVAITKQDSGSGDGGWGNGHGHHRHDGGGTETVYTHDESGWGIFGNDNSHDRVRYRVVESGDMDNGPNAVAFEVVRSNSEWTRFWRKVGLTANVYRNGSKSRSWDVDWDHDQVVVIQCGPTSLEGKALQIDRITRTETGYRITLTRPVLAGDTDTTRIRYPNYPYIVIELPGHDDKFDISVGVDTIG
jgi:hypothetical protein